MNIRRLCLIPLIVASLCLTSAASAEILDAQTLVEKLRQGGYVLYLRHTATDRTQTDKETKKLDDCRLQRNLSAAGRTQAKVIGQAIIRLQIPIGSVTSSPYCRCMDTAKLAFGRAKNSDELRFTITENAEQTLALSSALKKRLAHVPPAGVNNVIVSHTGNLKEAANIWPKPEGVLHVFHPLGNENFEHLGHIGPDQWVELK